MKWLWSETNQQLTQLAADIVGPDALTDGHPLGLRAAARARQLDRGRHDRDPQEHRRRARARPAPGSLGDCRCDSHSPRTSRRSSAPRTTCSPTARRWRRCARPPRRAPTTTRSGASWASWAGPGIAVGEEHGGQGLGVVELARAARGARLRVRAGAVPRQRARRAGDRARGLGRAAGALAARAGLAARLRGALGAADQLIPDAPGADVVVVVDAAAGTRARRRRRRGRSTRSTRRAATAASTGAGEQLDGDVAGAHRPRARRGQRRARRRLPARARHDGRLRQGAQAVRRPGRHVPGRPPLGGADAASTPRAGARATYYAAWAADAEPERLPMARGDGEGVDQRRRPLA